MALFWTLCFTEGMLYVVDEQGLIVVDYRRFKYNHDDQFVTKVELELPYQNHVIVISSFRQPYLAEASNGDFIIS